MLSICFHVLVLFTFLLPLLSRNLRNVLEKEEDKMTILSSRDPAEDIFCLSAFVSIFTVNLAGYFCPLDSSLSVCTVELVAGPLGLFRGILVVSILLI